MIWFIIFLFGLLIGSFLNCLIYRLENDQDFIKGRSYCPHCRKFINFYDLIPILSFLWLRGRCRNCSQKISFQYPLVELATGLIFVLIFQRGDLGLWGILETTYLLAIFSLLMVIFVYDLKHYLIPDSAIFTAIGLSLIWVISQTLTNRLTLVDFSFFLLSGIAAAGFFLVFFLLSQGTWLGFGDVKMALFMGLFLGYPEIIVALFSSFTIGAIIGLIMVLLKKKEMKSEVPFGPFLILGTTLAFFWGGALNLNVIF